MSVSFKKPRAIIQERSLYILPTFLPSCRAWLLILAEKRTGLKICTHSFSLLLKKKRKKSNPVNLLKLFKYGGSGITQPASVAKRVQSGKVSQWHCNFTTLTSQCEIKKKKCTSITQQRSDQFDIDYRKLNSQWRQARCAGKLFLFGSLLRHLFFLLLLV